MSMLPPSTSIFVTDSDQSRKRREEELLRKRRQTHTTHSRDRVLEAIPAMVQRLCSEHPILQSGATTQTRNLISLCEQCPPMDQALKEVVTPPFVQFLSRDDAPQLQLGSLLFLTSISSGSSQHKKLLVDTGVVPLLVKLLRSSRQDDIIEETLCILGNLADLPSYRHLVLDQGALLPLLHQLKPPHSRLSVFKIATLCLSNLVRGKPIVKFEEVKPALPVLQQLIHSTNEEVVTDACWALSYLLYGQTDITEALIEQGVCPRLVELLQYPSDTVILPALVALGNIAAGDDAQTQLVIDNHLLQRLHRLLTHEYKKIIYKEACFAISNITAGNRTQIQAVIDANLIPVVVHIDEFDIKKEAGRVIFHVSARGSYEHITYLAAQGCINLLCELLTCPDLMVVLNCLKALEIILSVGEAQKKMGFQEGVNVYALLVDECEGSDKIEKLVKEIDGNSDIFYRALKLLQKFWPAKFRDLF